MSDCEQCKSFYLELERLRRLVPNGTYTLNVAHEEELERMREAFRAAEKRELEALAERDEATAKLGTVAKLLVANGCDCECGYDSEGHDDDCERCLACKISAAIGELA